MNHSPILWPVLAQVLLTAVVWVRMFTARVAEMRARRIKPQEVATSRAIAEKLQNTQAADNFRNLFEVPVLFYAVCAMLVAIDAVTTPQLVLAWLFVGLRCAHSVIQLTYNRVMHRFGVYLASTLCVFGMWALLAARL